MEQLARVLGSETFRRSERSSALLRFVVERTLAGGADHLKEYTLGVEALGRATSFDPRTDPIVRAEASRLRDRLVRYYDAEGRMVTPEMAQAAGLDPKADITKGTVERASPLARSLPLMRRSLEKRGALGRAKRHSCRREAPASMDRALPSSR